MSGANRVIRNESVLSKLDLRLLKIETALAYISGVAIFSLMIFAVFSVGGRNFFSKPLPGYIDLLEQAMMLIAFVGISFVQRDGSHIRMDAIIGLFKGRFLWFWESFTTLLTLFVIAVLIYGSYHHFLRSFDISAPLFSRDSSMDIGIPLWPAKLIVPISFSILALRLIIQTIGFTKAFINNDTHPVAVPIIQTPAQSAADEAHQVD